MQHLFLEKFFDRMNGVDRIGRRAIAHSTIREIRGSRLKSKTTDGTDITEADADIQAR